MSPKNGFTVDTFVNQRYVKSTWIAFFVLWILWGLVYFLRNVVGDNLVHDNRPETSSNNVTEPVTTKNTSWNARSGYHSRLQNAHRVLFENTLLLLSVLVLNTFGTGSNRAVMILTWIYLALTIIFAFSELGVDSRFFRLAYNAIIFAIALAIGGLAFSHGW
ncbi:hypothetical protein BDF14DRAFT_1966557 [Spinellus fusiger]|nr:hypothetical protein BDF14DRAFT_1966557 [Spinellus fusiger]